MHSKRLLVVTALSLAALAAAPQANAANINERNGVRRVLLISIDGMHAVDYENCVNGINGIAPYCPALAALGRNGVNYTRTTTSRPSDSAPGLMALVTGGSPRSTGIYYDVAYDRVLAPPAKTTGNGVFGGNCIAGRANGTTTEYEEGVDFDQTQLNGGGPYSLTDGGILSINPQRLPRDPFNNCLPVYPWNFLRTNTIYGVIHSSGGYTAWSDKHAVYAMVSGPSNNASNIDDYYAPDVNSNVIALPMTTATGLACSVGNPPVPPDNNGATWTDSFQNIQCYDQLKVNAIVNEIGGRTHLGTSKAPVPNIFGMNFQAVSVGQKLIEKINGAKTSGGYLDAAGTPSGPLLQEIRFVDASIGQMVEALRDQGLLDSTLIIITAKHGQSPIDPHRFKEVGFAAQGAAITTTPADVVAAFLPPPPSPENPLTPASLGPIGPTQDDISLLWLNHSSDAAAAVGLLENNGDAAGVGEIFFGPSLETMFNAPGIPPAGDSRTPDIIVQPSVGVIYTTSSKKQEEHGGFAFDDTNVMLLVSNTRIDARSVNSFVETLQVAPTILQALGLDPNRLDAVQTEGTAVLPGLSFDSFGQ